MSTPETFLKELYEELALSFKQDYNQVIDEIKTFEQIFKDKKWKLGTRKKAKEILILLYQKKGEYARKAKYYRKMYLEPERTVRCIGWRKVRA